MNNMIYRQMAIAIIKDCMLDPDDCRYENAEEINGVLRFAKDKIKEVPSAQRTGRWKVSYLPKGKMKYCSECGFGQYIADERQYSFCPNCGADMRPDNAPLLDDDSIYG